MFTPSWVIRRNWLVSSGNGFPGTNWARTAAAQPLAAMGGSILTLPPSLMIRSLASSVTFKFMSLKLLIPAGLAGVLLIQQA